MLPSGEKAQTPHATGWLEKQQINLEAHILPASDTGKGSTLSWHQIYEIWC